MERLQVAAPARPRSAWAQRSGELLRTRRSAELAGALAALVAGVLLYTRYSIDGRFWRDEGIYAYAGQQWTHGTPPYASIFDPKGPGASLISAAAVALARLFGTDDVHLIRLAFFVCSLLTVLAVYLLVLQVWQSVTGAVVGGIVFASFKGFALDALSGPDAKTPGILFAVVAMWLAARRQWFWSAVASSLALLVWQPLSVYPVFVIVAAVVCTPERRRRALALAVSGVVLPLLLTAVYFASVSAFGKLVEGAVTFPVTGFQGGHLPFFEQLQHIAGVVRHFYGTAGMILIWGGLLLLLALVVGPVVAARGEWRAALRDPLVLVVLPTLLGEAAFALQDFQSYPRVYPFLPYAAAGCGGAVAVAIGQLRQPLARRVAVAAALVPAVALTGVSMWLFDNDPLNNVRLPAEQAMGCALNRLIVPGTPLYALGDPVPLVLTHRRNPDRFVYLESGVAQWKIDHTVGGFAGWTRQIADSRASVIVSQGWSGAVHDRMGAWLRPRYAHGFVGSWWIFLTPRARARAAAAGIAITRHLTSWPRTTQHTRFTCGQT